MTNSTLLPALSDRLFQLLFDFLPSYAAEGGSYTGLLLEGLPIGEWLPQLLDKLTEDERCYITLVGFSTSEEKDLLKTTRPRTDSGVEKAIDTRHNRPSSSWHLVVLRGPRESRIHSLTQRGYGIIGPDEVARFGAQQQAECSLNVPHIAFWKFLAQPVGGISLPLLGILEMLNYTASSPHPDLYNTLPLLDLLPDKHLFQHVDKLPARLHENAALVARLQEHEHSDLRRAFEVSRSETDPQQAADLRTAYAAFARLKPGQAVRDWADSIPLARARQLLLSPLNGKPAPPVSPPLGGFPVSPINPTPGPDDDEPGNNGGNGTEGGTGTPPGGGYEPGSGPDGPEPGEDDDDDITTLRRRTREKVNARPARPKLEASLDEAIIRRAAEISPAELLKEATVLTKDLRRNLRKFAEGKLAKTVWLLQSPSCYVDHPHERTSARLTQAFCGPDLLGGRLELPATMSLTTAARADLTPVTTDAFGQAYENKLRQALADLAPLLSRGVDAAALLTKWLSARELLAREADLLTAAPLAALLSDAELRDAARASQEAYRELCQTLADHYDVLRREGADVVLPDVLRLDTVEVRSMGRDTSPGGYVLLAPLHPLVLWKYAELADVLEDQANEGAGKNLHDLLPEWPESMVEPLRAVVIPDAVGRVQPLAFAGRCGTWPEYQPSGTVRERSSGGLLVAAAHKMALLYPPVLDSLRLIVHHPTRLEGFTRDLRTLLASKARPDKPVFRNLHLTLTYPLGGQPLPLPIEWAGWLREGDLIVEQTERGDLRPSEKVAPAHLLLVPATYRIDNLQVDREPSSLHPLSLPRRLRYQTYRERPILEPRSQQSDDTDRYPFGAFHELISRFGGRPDQEASGMLTPEIPPEHLPTVLTGTVWAILPEHPYPLSEEQLALKHDTTQHGQMVITGYGRRFRDRVKWMLEQMDYVPKPDKLTNLLRDLDGVGQTGLFHLISSKDTSGFSDTALKGQFGLAVALRWYEQNVAKTPYHVVLSLDSAMARRWLCQRDTNQRTDLLGLRYGSDEQWHVDLIEVKAYAVGPNPDNGPGTPGEQLRAMAKVLLPILQLTGGDLLTDCRRELLREQLYLEGREYLKGPSDIEPRSWAEWIDQLDALLNGTQKAKLNLLLLEVNLNRNDESGCDIVPGDPTATDEAYRRDLEFWHINQPDIQTLVSDLVTPNPPQAPPSFPLPPVPTPTPPNEPSSSSDPSDRPDKSPSDDVEVVVPDAGSTAVASNQMLPSPSLTPSAPQSETKASPSAAPQPETKAAPSKEIQHLALRLYEVLQDFHLPPAASIDPYQADIGPSIIRFKVRLERNQKLPQLQARAIDMQRELSLTVVPRIDNLSGTTYVAVEIPRPDPQIAPLSPILVQGVPSDIGPLPIPVGVAPNGQVKWLSLASLPHLLVGGTSGSGKTRFLWSLLLSLRHLSPAGSVEWVLIDPKQTDFTIFNNWPEVRGGRVIIEPEEAVETLQELLATELVTRTNLLRQYECVNLLEYRAKTEAPPLPYLVVVIDEYADLVESLPKRERAGFELAVGRLAQRARNVGIHLVIATQRPDSKIISGNLKNNLGGRIAFQLASGVDSRVVLDQNGAENLLGQGDLLVRQGGAVQRLQGFFVTTDELRNERNR